MFWLPMTGVEEDWFDSREYEMPLMMAWDSSMENVSPSAKEEARLALALILLESRTSVSLPIVRVEEG